LDKTLRETKVIETSFGVFGRCPVGGGGLRVVSTQRTGGIRMILWDERRRRLISFREMHTATSMTGGMKLPEIRQ
jgi:hypothetical protein